MTYEELLNESDHEELIVKEKDLRANMGRISGKRIAIRKDLTTAQKSSVLAEELGHYHTTCGDILNSNDESATKQELRARIWAYDHQIGLGGIVRAYQKHCQSFYEIADYLDVSEAFLQDAIDYYREKYGVYVQVERYIIYFSPTLGVYEAI